MKQMTFKDNFGKIQNVVFESQMNEYLNLMPGSGYCVEIKPTVIEVLDRYTRETVGTFQILSLEDISGTSN